MGGFLANNYEYHSQIKGSLDDTEIVGATWLLRDEASIVPVTLKSASVLMR